jgi:hypothetical protein
MATAKLHRSQSSANGKKFTVSCWVKQHSVVVDGGIWQFNTDASNSIHLYSNPTVKLRTYISGNYNSGDQTTAYKARDPSGWIHYVSTFDTANADATLRNRVWINGELITTGSKTNAPQDTTYAPVVSGTFEINKYDQQTTYSDHSYSHIHYCDGYAYQASDFGEADSVSGIWKPKTAPSVSYGSNGVFLKFENSSAMGTDSSGNSNNMTVTGTVTQMNDSPSNVFATLNGIHVGGGASTLSNGNTTYSLSNYSYNTRSTLGMPSGKFYWEQKVNASSSVRIGLCTSGFTTDLDTDNANAYYGGSGGGGVYLLLSNTTTSWQYTNNDTSRNTGTYSTAIASGSTSILMGAVDVDAGKLWIGVDGVWFNSGNPATGSNATLTFTNNSGDDLQIFAGYGTSSARVSSFNFGNGYFGTTAVASAGTAPSEGGIFEYDCPSGYQALCTKGINSF